MLFQMLKAIVLMGLGVFMIYELHPLAKIIIAQSARAEGTVAQILSEGWSRNHGQVVTREVRITFTPSDGREISLTTSLFQDQAREADVGKKFLIRYDPQTPCNSDVVTVQGLVFYVYGLYAVGGGLGWAGFVILWRTFRRDTLP